MLRHVTDQAKKEYNKTYYEKNKARILAKNAEYRASNKDAIDRQRREYRARTKGHIALKNKEYLPIKKAKIKERRLNDDQFRIAEVIRSKVHKMIRGLPTSYRDLLGIDHGTFKAWMAFQFDDGMSWDNYGSKWHIDHSHGESLGSRDVQYHEVKINIQLASSVDGVSSSDADLTVQCYVDYVYLDTEERRRFAQTSHEYLITQLQFTGDESVTVASDSRSQNIRLNFNHPTKFLAWVFKGSKHGQYTAQSTSDYANINTYAEALAPLKSAKLQLNGHDRFSERKGSYFNLVTPYQALRTRPPAGVYLFSFSIKPDELQPSGTINLSRIDNATLNISMKAASRTGNVSNVISEDVTLTGATSLTALKIFAENYNVFRIMSGINLPVPNSKLPSGFQDSPRGANSGSSWCAAQAA